MNDHGSTFAPAGRRREAPFACALALSCAALLLLPASARSAIFVSDGETVATVRFHFFGRWEHVRNAKDGRVDGSSSRSASPGAAVTLAFYGRTVRLYGVRGPGGGHGILTIDGHRYPDIDFYAPRKMPRVVIFSSPVLDVGKHLLAIASEAEPRDAHHRSSYINLSGATYQ